MGSKVSKLRCRSLGMVARRGANLPAATAPVVLQANIAEVLLESKAFYKGKEVPYRLVRPVFEFCFAASES